MNISYSKNAVKAINGMDRPAKQRIKTAIEKLPEGDVKPFKGSPGTYRLRIGTWRILFSCPEEDSILIEKIGPRGGIYKGV